MATVHFGHFYPDTIVSLTLDEITCLTSILYNDCLEEAFDILYNSMRDCGDDNLPDVFHDAVYLARLGRIYQKLEGKD